MDIECSSVSQICKRQVYNTHYYSLKLNSREVENKKNESVTRERKWKSHLL